MEIPNRNWMDDCVGDEVYFTRALPHETIYARLERLGWTRGLPHRGKFSGKSYYDRYYKNGWECRISCYSVFMPLVFFNPRKQWMNFHPVQQNSHNWIERM